MAGGGGVEHDQVGHAGPLELLHLAEHEDVLDARGGGGHHVEGAAREQAAGDPVQAVVLEVLEEGVVGGEQAGPDVGRALGATAGMEHDLVVAEGRSAVEAADAALALDLHDEGRQPGARRGPGQGGAHGAFADAPLPGHDEHP